MNKKFIKMYVVNRVEQILKWSTQHFNVNNIDIKIIFNFESDERSYIKGLINDFVMVLNLKDWVVIPNDIERLFKEYDSFADDVYIGDFLGEWNECLDVLLCHEIAHAIDVTRVIKFIIGDNVEILYDGEFKRTKIQKNLFKNRTHHNSSWKKIYLILRSHFLSE